MNRIKELINEEDFKKLRKEYGPLADHIAIHQKPDHTLRAVICFEATTLMPHSDTVPYASADCSVFENLLRKTEEGILGVLQMKKSNSPGIAESKRSKT